MEKATIIFDFDGTLHDSMFIYRIALMRGYDLLVEQGLVPAREFTDEFIAGNIGLTCQDAWERMCPDLPYSVTEQAAIRVGEVMDELIENGTARLFPGVPEMLQQVKDAGYKIITDGIQDIAFWDNGARYFFIQGPNNEKIEFCEIL